LKGRDFSRAADNWQANRLLAAEGLLKLETEIPSITAQTIYNHSFTPANPQKTAKLLVKQNTSTKTRNSFSSKHLREKKNCMIAASIRYNGSRR
jgi:hypothetical protein